MKFVRHACLIPCVLLVGLWLPSCARVPAVMEADPQILRLKEAVRQSPNDPQRRTALGLLYLQKYKQAEGKNPLLLEGAIQEGQEAIQLKPDLAHAHLVIGEGLSLKALKNPDEKLLEEAMTHIREAFRLGPQLTAEMVRHPSHIFVARGYLRLAESKKDPKLVDRAVEIVKEAIRVMPDSAGSHKLLGVIYQYQEKSELALLELQEAARLNPDDAGTHKLLGRIYHSIYHKRVHSVEDDGADEGAIDLGIKEFKQVIRLTPEDPEAHAQLARLYGHKGLYDLQVFEAKEALRLDPSVQNHYALGRAFLFNGQYERTLHEYRLILRDKPDFGVVHGDIAFAYFLQLRMTDAIKKFEQYFEIVGSRHPVFPVIWQHLALKHVRNDREAMNLLDRHESNIGWQSDLVRYHQGELVESELLSRATHKGEQCEAYFYIGYRYFLKGDKEKARRYFQATMDTKVFDYYEYIAARTRLEQLSAD